MHGHKHTQLDIDVKPQIDYPCKWSYRVIGLHKDHVNAALKNVFGNKDVDISPIEHHSKNHKYVAINCSINVENNEERLAYFNGLVEQYGIVMVI